MADDIIQIHDEHLRATLARRITALRSPARLMAGIANDLHGGVEDVLKAEGMPKWRGLSSVTKERRRERGHWPGKMLQEYGQLAASIQPDSGEAFAQVSTNLKKARTLHFGAKQGEFGRSKRGGPIPWGNIPARPFMVIPAHTRATIAQRAAKWIAAQ